LLLNIVWDELLMTLLQQTERKTKTKHPYLLTYIESVQGTSEYYTIPIGMGLWYIVCIYTLTLKLHLAIVVNAVGTRVLLQFFPP
jgi:hypothetical protein